MGMIRVITSLQEYDKEYWKITSKIAKWVIKLFRIKKNKTVVDVGCGFGALTIPLAKNLKKCKIIAVDKDKDYLLRLKNYMKKIRTKNINFIESDFREMKKIKNNSVDFVFSHWVLSSMLNKKELEQSFKEFYRILKPNGIVAHIDGCPKNESENLWKEIDETGFIARWWSIDELRIVMKKVGLKEIKTNFFKIKFRLSPNVLIEDVKRERDSNLFGLIAYLNKNKRKIEKFGVEFPTEYLIYGKK